MFKINFPGTAEWLVFTIEKYATNQRNGFQ